MRFAVAIRRSICRVLIGAFVFAQLAVSAYACPAFGHPSASVTEMSADAMAPGCDQIDADAANLCAEHCKVGQQGNQSNSAPVVMAPTLDLLYVVSTEDTAHELEAIPRPAVDPLLAAKPPPHAILHCVLRI